MVARISLLAHNSCNRGNHLSGPRSVILPPTLHDDSIEAEETSPADVSLDVTGAWSDLGLGKATREEDVSLSGPFVRRSGLGHETSTMPSSADAAAFHQSNQSTREEVREWRLYPRVFP